MDILYHPAMRTLSSERAAQGFAAVKTGIGKVRLKVLSDHFPGVFVVLKLKVGRAGGF